MKRNLNAIFAAALAMLLSLQISAATTPGQWHVRKIHPPHQADSLAEAAPTDSLPAIITTCDPADAEPQPQPAPTSAAVTQISISGKAIVTDPETIAAFVRRNNKDFPVEIAEAYIRIGDLYGIRGDIALCQAILETGWFRFADGTAVTPDQNNYCGMGVTSRGMKGCTFETIDDGVTAHIQHLFAYARREPLPKGETLLDPRFKLVSRGVAPNWTDLSNRWAMNPNYGAHILQLFNQLQSYANNK